MDEPEYAGTMSSPEDRRRWPRVTPGPLKVSMFEQDGVLVDISQSGACIRVALALASNAVTPFILKWDEDILLNGRIVRSWVDRTQHRIGVEFVGLAPRTAIQLRRLTVAAAS
ncbi:MAG: PilZ domain-containing protein [Acidimicrobiia bacterium]|nr:PilZ domain-containing protein [Acidimicrobiia bacterium]